MPRCLYGVISYKFIPVGWAIFLSVVRRLSAMTSHPVGKSVYSQQADTIRSLVSILTTAPRPQADVFAVSSNAVLLANFHSIKVSSR